MNKSKRLRLERQAVKSFKLSLEEKRQLERLKLYEELKQIGKVVAQELEQEVVV